MDNSNALKLAINIINADDDVNDSLSDGNIKTYKTSDGIAFAYDPNAYDTYDELADDASPTMKLGILNTDDEEYYDQPDLTKSLSQYLGIDDVNDLDLSILPDLSDFIDEKQDDINKAIENINDKYYSLDNTDEGTSSNGASTNQVDEVNSALSYDPQSATFSTAPTTNDSDNDLIDDNRSALPSSEDVNNTYDERPYDDNLDKSDDYPNQAIDTNTPSTDIQPKPSIYLDLARELFADSDQSEIVEFDPNTHKQLQSQIVEVEKNIANGRGNGVMRIYKRIQDQLPELTKAFEADFKENVDVHKNTLDTIDANEKDDIARVTKEHRERYETGKQQFIDAKRESLSEQYDAENRDAFTKSLNAAINSIRANSEALRHQEERKFETFKKGEKEKYIKHEIKSNINIDDIMSDYNKLVNADNEMLKKAGTHFADQLGSMTKDIIDKLKSTKEEAEDWKSKYKSLSSTYTQQVEAETTHKTNQNVSVLQTQLDSSNRELRERNKENATLQSALEDEQRKSKEAKSLADQYKAQLDLLKNHPYQAPNYYPTQPIVSPQPSAPQQPTEAKPEPAAPVRENTKKSHGGAIASMIMGGLALVGLCVGGTAMFMQHQANVRIEQATSSVSRSVSSRPQAQAVNDNVTKKYHAGDTWTYHNEDDDKNYTVTMANSTTGYYTDKNGQQHTITLKK